MNQEVVRYSLTVGYGYLAYLALSCPCDVILGCHVREWAVASVLLTALTALNIFYFGAPKTLAI